MTQQATPQTISITLLTLFSSSWVENSAYTVHHNYNLITIKKLEKQWSTHNAKFTSTITLKNIEIKQELCPQLCACAEALPLISLMGHNYQFFWPKKTISPITNNLLQNSTFGHKSKVDNLLDWCTFIKKPYPLMNFHLQRQVLPSKTLLRLVSYTPSNVHGIFYGLTLT